MLSVRLLWSSLSIPTERVTLSRSLNPTTPCGIDPQATALLLVDPLNDFLATDGLLWPLIRDVAIKVELHANLTKLLEGFRVAGACIAYAPHRRWDENAYAGWSFMNASQAATQKMRLFNRSGPGGKWYEDLRPSPEDLVASEHHAQSGFAHTDLEIQLRQRGITHLVIAGLLANTCIESTARYAMELGFHVTLVRDATAASNEEAMRTTHDINGPTYAHWITETHEVLKALHTNDSTRA